MRLHYPFLNTYVDNKSITCNIKSGRGFKSYYLCKQVFTLNEIGIE